MRFNRRGQLIERLRNGVGPSWEYDADGNRTAMVDPQGTRTEFGHDAAGRVVVVEHPVFGRISYERDAAGRMVGAVASDAVQGWRFAQGALVSHTTTTVDGVTETLIRRDGDGRDPCRRHRNPLLLRRGVPAGAFDARGRCGVPVAL